MLYYSTLYVYIYMLWLVKTPNLHWQQGQNSQTLQVQSGSLFSATTCKSLRCLQCGKDWIGLMATRILWAPGSKELPRSKPMATSENNPLPPTPYGLPWANALWYMPSSLIGTQVWIGVSGGTPCQAEVQRCRFTLPKIQHLENIHRCTHCHQLFSAIGGGFWTMLDF